MGYEIKWHTCKHCSYPIYEYEDNWCINEELRRDAWSEYGWLKEWGTYSTFCPALFDPDVPHGDGIQVHEPRDQLLIWAAQAQEEVN